MCQIFLRQYLSTLTDVITVEIFAIRTSKKINSNDFILFTETKWNFLQRKNEFHLRKP